MFSRGDYLECIHPSLSERGQSGREILAGQKVIVVRCYRADKFPLLLEDTTIGGSLGYHKLDNFTKIEKEGNTSWNDLQEGDRLVCLYPSLNSNTQALMKEGKEVILEEKGYKDSGDFFPLKLKDPETGRPFGWYQLDNFKKIKTETKKGGKTMEYLKNYFNSHKETFITLAIVILVDEYLLGGSLREKVKTLVEKILKQSEKKLIKNS